MWQKDHKNKQHIHNINPSAEKGWEQMQHLLDVKMPVTSNENGNKKKYSILFLLLLIAGCGSYTFIKDLRSYHADKTTNTTSKLNSELKTAGTSTARYDKPAISISKNIIEENKVLTQKDTPSKTTINSFVRRSSSFNSFTANQLLKKRPISRIIILNMTIK